MRRFRGRSLKVRHRSAQEHLLNRGNLPVSSIISFSKRNNYALSLGKFRQDENGFRSAHSLSTQVDEEEPFPSLFFCILSSFRGINYTCILEHATDWAVSAQEGRCVASLQHPVRTAAPSVRLIHCNYRACLTNVMSVQCWEPASCTCEWGIVVVPAGHKTRAGRQLIDRCHCSTQSEGWFRRVCKTLSTLHRHRLPLKGTLCNCLPSC